VQTKVIFSKFYVLKKSR